MRSLIILKGLVKKYKKEWVRQEGLENYFLDMDVFKKMYSLPDLLSPNQPILGKSFGDIVYKRFIEVVNVRLSKGCLVVVDMDNEPTQILEILALIYGYTVFYVVQDIPQDYISKQKQYSIPYYATKRRGDLEKEVTDFMNLQLSDKLKISEFQDVLNYWKEREEVHYITATDRILHVSDLHSNLSLYKQLPDFKKYSFVVFHGDYIDGPEKGGSRKLIDKIIKTHATKYIWLEGNHEIRLRRYLGWLMLKSTGKKEVTEYLYNSLPHDFLTTTAEEFKDLNAEEAKHYLEVLNERLKMYTILNFPDTRFICTHAGILFKEQLDPRFIGNVIYGNREMNRFDRSFSEASKREGLWSIHAHCKYPDSWEPMRYDRVINLDPEDENEVVYGEQKNKEWNICTIQRKLD